MSRSSLLFVAIAVLSLSLSTAQLSTDRHSDREDESNTQTQTDTETETEADNDEFFSHCIIGAGPAGVQLGYFLHEQSRSYVILERNSVAGSFFSSYPRHRRLISINKKYTPKSNVNSKHPDFKMRHDWNSLLTTPVDTRDTSDVDAFAAATERESLLFGNWSDEYYPNAQTVVEYTDSFARHFNLNIRFGTVVDGVYRHSDDGSSNGDSTQDKSADDGSASEESTTGKHSISTRRFTLKVRPAGPKSANEQSSSIGCGSVVVATGLASAFVPPNMRKVDAKGEPLVVGYEDVPLDREFFRGKEVLILGKGNAAFELASNISAISAATTIVSRSALRLSYVFDCDTEKGFLLRCWCFLSRSLAQVLAWSLSFVCGGVSRSVFLSHCRSGG